MASPGAPLLYRALGPSGSRSLFGSLSQELAVWNESHSRLFTWKSFLPLLSFSPTEQVEEVEVTTAGQCRRLNFYHGHCRLSPGRSDGQRPREAWTCLPVLFRLHPGGCSWLLNLQPPSGSLRARTRFPTGLAAFGHSAGSAWVSQARGDCKAHPRHHAGLFIFVPSTSLALPAVVLMWNCGCPEVPKRTLETQSVTRHRFCYSSDGYCHILK